MKNLYSRLLLLLLVIACYPSRAQLCGFDQIHQHLMATDTAYQRMIQQNTNKWAQFVQTNSNSLIIAGNPTIYEIPVVVHIMHTGGAVGSIYNPTDAQITGMIAYLNQSYAATYSGYPDTLSGGVNIPIRFKLAARDKNCNATTGIDRVDMSTNTQYVNSGVNSNPNGNVGGLDDSTLKNYDRWNVNDYYNIWIVDKIDGVNGTSGTFIAGFAYFAGASAKNDGTIMLATTAIAGDIVLPHEIGHAMGLYHPFEGGTTTTCPLNTNCSTQGDQVCDTEPIETGNPSTCPTTGLNPCTNAAYNNIAHNFMNYSTCQNRFTAGQRTKALFNLINMRYSLLTSLGSTPPATSSLTIPTAACIPGIVNVNNNNEVGVTQVTFNDLLSSSGDYTTEGYVTYIDHNLDCSQSPTAHVTAGSTYQLSVTGGPLNPENAGVWIDYNNDGTFQASEKVLTGAGTTAGQTFTANITIPTTAITCTTLRMRVMSDYAGSNAPQPCVSVGYGQTEDFSVYIQPTSPTVTIAANPAGPVCAGASVTFTATPTNGGISPTYQWKKNSTVVGTGSTYTSTTLSNNDTIICYLTSSSACAGTTVASNSIIMTVNPVVVPIITIAANPGNTICAGISVTYTATITNGGATPTYVWKKNSSNVGTGATYTSAAPANGDIITCTLASNATCATPASVTSSAITMVVNASVTPTIAIAANPGNTVCLNTSVTYTATITNGGTTPTYVWTKNGINVGTGATYTNAIPANGDIIICALTSNAACATSTTATSNTITMVVSSLSVPTIVIAANPGTTVCANTSVTYSTTITNGGTTPAYSWKKNGTVVSTTATYTNATPANGDLITCTLTSNASCAIPPTVTSNTLTMVVSNSIAPAISITANPGNTVCSNTSVTYSVTITNGGTSPVYGWKKNGTVVSNTSTYTNATPTNGDVITCDLTSSASCASPASVTSSAITMVVTTSVIPTITISANPGTTICAGTSVTFSASTTNGGAAPVYSWKKNGGVVSTASTYTTTTLANGDLITCDLTSNAACAPSAAITSAALTMVVTPSVAPAISIAANPGTTVCAGTSVTYTATITNGGTTPTYSWKKNGIVVGTLAAYTNAASVNGDIITCTLTSNAACATATTVTSSQLTMFVTPVVTPTITISSNAGTTICAGASVTFSAVTTNGGTTPVFNWKRNGTSVSTAATYTTTALVNGDVITCDLSSSLSCIAAATVTSSSITMVVNPNLTPAIAIFSSVSASICAGATVTFTASISNGGASPAYTWKKNGVTVSTAGNSYTTATLINGDVITCQLTSTATCATPAIVTSNSIIMTVITPVTPTIVISSTATGTVCSGTTIGFSTVITNGGSTPTYQWQKNGLLVSGSTTYFSNTLVTGDIITCTLISNNACATLTTVTSNAITMTVTPSVTPTISITSYPGDTVCAGTNVGFAANTTNEGLNPVYQWIKNNQIVGTSAPIYSDNNPLNTDYIYCLLTSSATCVTAATVTSNTHLLKVAPIPTPVISVVNSAQLATTSNFSTYQWYLNGVIIAGATNVLYMPTVSGNYTVFVTDAYDCSGTSPVVSFTYTTPNVGVPNVGTSNDVSFYPNPAQTVVYIKSDKLVDVTIRTVEGKVLLQQTGIDKIDISKFADGLYLVEIRAADHQLLKMGRLVKTTN